MAVPFYDSKVNDNSNNNNNNTVGQQSVGTGDQVDGPSNHNSNYIITMPQNLIDTNATTTTNTINVIIEEPPDEDIMPWKILALTMCKILKTFYQQHLHANNLDNSSTKSSSEFSHTKPSWQ